VTLEKYIYRCVCDAIYLCFSHRIVEAMKLANDSILIPGKDG
jgi:hypothetical protein